MRLLGNYRAEGKRPASAGSSAASPSASRERKPRVRGEIGELGAVARRGDDEAAGDRRHRNIAGPEGERLLPELGDQRIGLGRLAPGRDHAAGVKGAALPRLARLLDELDRAPAAAPARAISKAAVKPATPAPITRISMAAARAAARSE